MVLMENGSKGEETLSKEQEYFAYINEHKNNVLKAYENLFKANSNFFEISGNTDILEAMGLLETNHLLEQHDDTKYSDEEFDAYRVKFYPTKDEAEKYATDEAYKTIADENFNKAWEHHYTNNDHHPNFWAKKNENEALVPNTDMEMQAIVHMICDWQAMSYKFKSDMWEWFENDADSEKGCMTLQTKSIVTGILNLLRKLNKH